jgi:hypothetical protein
MIERMPPAVEPAKGPAIEVERASLAGPPELAARFDRVRARPWRDDALAFEALVPKDLAALRDLERREPPPGDLLRIGSFRGAAGESLDVAVARPGRDVGLADFFASLAERFSLEVVDIAPLDFGGREAVDALARWTLPGEGPRVSRIVLFRNGDAVVRLTGTAPAPRYGALAESFAVALSTFRFLAPRPCFFLEPYDWAASIGAIPLGFRRPLAWKLDERRDAPWGRQIIDLRLVEAGSVAASIRAKSVDRDTAGDLDLEGLATETLDDLRALGFATAALRQRLAPPSPGAPFDARTFGLVHDGRADGKAAEARVICLRSDRALYAIAAVLPSREKERLAWMGAKRALDVLYQTLNRPEDEVLFPPALRRAAAPEPAAPPPPPPSPAAPARAPAPPAEVELDAAERALLEKITGVRLEEDEEDEDEDDDD